MLPAIMLLSVMGALLLLIVCANVSNLVSCGSQPTRRDRGASGARRQSQSYTALAFRREPGAGASRRSPGDAGVSGIDLLFEPTSLASLAPVPVGLNVSLDWTAVVRARSLVRELTRLRFHPALRSSRVDLAGT